MSSMKQAFSMGWKSMQYLLSDNHFFPFQAHRRRNRLIANFVQSPFATPTLRKASVTQQPPKPPLLLTTYYLLLQPEVAHG